MKGLWLILVIILLGSCQRQVLFQTKTNSIDTALQFSDTNKVHIITCDDKFNISIWNHDDISIGSIYGIYNSNEVYGKWLMLDTTGKIVLPLIGEINMKGLTVRAAENKLQTEYAKYIKDPIVHIRMLNKKVTVIGEVIKPGNYLIEKENTNIMEIIAEAGGFDFYANKRKIKIIRIENGITKQRKINLTKYNALDNFQTQLKSGDIVYIPPTASKTIDKKVQTLIPVASIVTASILLIKFLSGTL